MPELDGLSTATLLREKHKLIMPIIALSAHAMRADIEKSLAACMSAHVTKPIDPSTLYQVLAEQLKITEFITSSVEAFSNTDAKTPRLVLDKSRALQALFNDEAVYASLLDDFRALAPKLTVLIKAIEHQQQDEVMQTLHIFGPALKYIGAFELGDRVASLEAILRQQTKAMTPDFVAELVQVVAQLQSLYEQMNHEG